MTPWQRIFSLTLVLVLSLVAVNLASAQSPTPDEALQKLQNGNVRFVEGQATNPRGDCTRRTETAKNGQKPFATVLTCSDSRLPTERVFDQGVGDLFVVRVAGNVCDTDEAGSIEYGVGHLETPLLVVLGHTQCGAVTAVATDAKVGGCIPQLVDNIGPAVNAVRRASPTLRGKELVAAAIEMNIWQSIDDLCKNSPEVRERAKAGKLKIVGALYHIDTGAVEWLGTHPQQYRLMAYTGGQNEHAQDEHADATDNANKHEATDHRVASTAVKGAKHEKTPSANLVYPHTASAAAKKDSSAPPRKPAEQTPANIAAHGGKTTETEKTGLSSPAEALQRLKDGNARYAADKPENPRADAARLEETAQGQHPFATILGCSDSRVPLERVFDQGFGDLFVVRVAGNIADTDEIGSIEYGAGHLGTPLLVVLGHTQCGAVTAVATDAKVHGSIPNLIDNIKPAIMAAQKENPSLRGKELVPPATKANVFQSIQDTLMRSHEIAELVKDGKLLVVGAVYDLESGHVEWLGPHPRQAAILADKNAD